MQFQGDKTKDKVKLDLSEHFILTNFISRMPIYAAMWIIALALGAMLSSLPMPQPVTDYAGMRAFSIAFITIATTTITFAIPTCMRSIFSTYEQYYSTKISEILLQRFPVTLLALSAFTSLLISVMIVSGIVGITIPVSPASAFYVALFWTLVCVFYLFVAIEKMVYFIANAPYAVIEKLEYGVGSVPEITTKEEYDSFRQELASMNDIASTIISRSTGQDDTVTEILEAFQQIHHHYLITANQSDHSQFRYHMNACRAVDHEIVRMFRTASTAKNEQACRNIIRAYCAMLKNAMATSSKVGYFADMMEQIARFQSYASACAVEEIKTLASVTWFFMLGDMMEDSDKYVYQKYSIVVRMLTAALRQASEQGEDSIIVKFLRIASNSEIEPDINNLSKRWRELLDRAVFVYATWIVDMIPQNAERYMEYIRRYSSIRSEVFRSVLPDSKERAQGLLTYENIVSIAIAEQDNNAQDTVAKIGEGQTAMILSLSLEDTSAHTMMLIAILDRAGIEWQDLPRYGRIGEKLLDEIRELAKEITDPEIATRLTLVSIIDQDISDHIKEFAHAAR